jgi:hypothetical protein
MFGGWVLMFLLAFVLQNSPCGPPTLPILPSFSILIVILKKIGE